MRKVNPSYRFFVCFDLTLANTCFWKREEHLIIYKSLVKCSKIDFFNIRKSDIKICLDRKVISRESLTAQHRVLAMNEGE